MQAGDRVLDFTNEPAYLCVRSGCLSVRRENEADITVPLKEIAVLILCHKRVTLTQSAIAGIVSAGGTIIVCDDRSLPCGLMLPLVANAVQTKRMISQAQAKIPVRKRLWKQIVEHKVRSQAFTLQLQRQDDFGLRELAKKVRSGDPQNIEAQAAARYWPALFGAQFRRRRDAEDQNRLLNYGYAVLRACVGRAVCAAGLHPSIGVHHHSRTNPWCLADDLMEPYRPLVDQAVARLVDLYTPQCPLDAEAKRELVAVLSDRIGDSAEFRTVSEHVFRSAVSLARVFTGEGDTIAFPDGLSRA